MRAQIVFTAIAMGTASMMAAYSIARDDAAMFVGACCVAGILFALLLLQIPA